MSYDVGGGRQRARPHLAHVDGRLDKGMPVVNGGDHRGTTVVSEGDHRGRRPRCGVVLGRLAGWGGGGLPQQGRGGRIGWRPVVHLNRKKSSRVTQQKTAHGLLTANVNNARTCFGTCRYSISRGPLQLY